MNWKIVGALLVGAGLLAACGASQQSAATSSDTRTGGAEAAPPPPPMEKKPVDPGQNAKPSPAPTSNVVLHE